MDDKLRSRLVRCTEYERIQERNYNRLKWLQLFVSVLISIIILAVIWIKVIVPEMNEKSNSSTNLNYSYEISSAD